MSTTADDLDAAVLNPAGIGGLNWGKGKVPALRKLYFPWVGGSINENSSRLNDEFRKQGGATDVAVGQAIVDANAGKRQYARTSALLGAVSSRTLLAPFADQQIAAVSRGEDSGEIDMRYRSMSGIAYGFSATDTQERFAIGYSGFLVNRKEIAGTFNYTDIISVDGRKEALTAGTTKYSATVHNAGIIWTMAKTARPTLGIALKNAGNTIYKTKTEGAEDMEIEQDLTLGFSVMPQLSKNTSLTFVTEGQQLSDDDVTLAKKYRIGTELLYDGFGSYAMLGLRAGFHDAGPSFGVSVNLGLIAFEAAQQSVDIGIGNEKVIEQRVSGTFSVNVADF